MAIQFQNRGGTQAENDAFTGAARELSVDTTNNELRVHDGVTPGGHKVGAHEGTYIKASGTTVPRTLADWAEKEILSYDSLADAVADPLLEVGRRVKTYGHYTAGDGGGADYIVTSGLSPEAGIVIAAGTKQLKLAPRLDVNIREFGIITDGTTDAGNGIQSFIDKNGFLGGKVELTHDTYLAQDGITITQPFNFNGAGTLYSGINSNSGGAAIVIDPDPNVDMTLCKIQDLYLGNPNNGTLGSINGLQALTGTATKFLPKLTLRDIHVGDCGQPGFVHGNNVANVQGGMYAAAIENSIIKGGIALIESGDSNTISKCILTGSGVGVNENIIAGASCLAIENNNITNIGGAINISSGSRFRIHGNNTESIVAGPLASNNGACFNIVGTSSTMYGGAITENLISRFGGSDATHCMKLSNCRGTLVQDNVFLSDDPSTVSIEIYPDSQDVRIGANSFNTNLPNNIVDNGVGTMGIIKTPVLSNAWVEFSPTQAPIQYIKSTDGMVHITGSMKDGVTTNGTVIFTLPIGFRPDKIIRAPIMVVNAGTPQIAEMSIESDGSCRIIYVNASNQVSVNITFAAANLANSVSLE